MENQTQQEPVSSLIERATSYNKEMETLLAKYNLEMSVAFNFPNPQKTPFLSRIAIAIIRLQGGLIGVRVSNKAQ